MLTWWEFKMMHGTIQWIHTAITCKRIYSAWKSCRLWVAENQSDYKAPWLRLRNNIAQSAWPLYGESFPSSLALPANSRKSSMRSREMRDWLNTNLSTQDTWPSHTWPDDTEDNAFWAGGNNDCYSDKTSLTLSLPLLQPCGGSQKAAPFSQNAPAPQNPARSQTLCTSQAMSCQDLSSTPELRKTSQIHTVVAICEDDSNPVGDIWGNLIWHRS